MKDLTFTLFALSLSFWLWWDKLLCCELLCGDVKMTRTERGLKPMRVALRPSVQYALRKSILQPVGEHESRSCCLRVLMQPWFQLTPWLQPVNRLQAAGPLKAILSFLAPRNHEKCCFKLLCLGVFCFMVIHNYKHIKLWFLWTPVSLLVKWNPNAYSGRFNSETSMSKWTQAKRPVWGLVGKHLENNWRCYYMKGNNWLI